MVDCRQPAVGDFADYVRSTRPRLHRDAFRLCGDWHEAEDLAQATLIRMYRRWAGLNRRHELNAYARTTLLRVYLTEHRRSHWRHEISTQDFPEREPVRTTSDDRLAVLAALRRLGARQRAVLVLRFWYDLSVETTARVLGCSTGNVTSQTARGLKILRAALVDRW